MPSQWLDLLDSLGEVERWTSIAFVAGQVVTIEGEELNEALRRALVVRAVGGDPHRELELDEEAVTRLADELDAPERRVQLLRGLAEIPRDRPRVGASVAVLEADGDLAWRAFAAALLANELADEA